jgi:hypothetical protein
MNESGRDIAEARHDALTARDKATGVGRVFIFESTERESGAGGVLDGGQAEHERG